MIMLRGLLNHGEIRKIALFVILHQFHYPNMMPLDFKNQVKEQTLQLKYLFAWIQETILTLQVLPSWYTQM
jgi:hypothetical protein